MLFNTFRVAAGLKIVGVFVGMGSAYMLTQSFYYRRWHIAMVVSVMLFVWLLPWMHWVAAWDGRKHTLLQSDSSIHRQHMQLGIALTFALLMPALELIDATRVDPQLGLLGPLGWTLNQINDVHALGMMFLMVPVVLAGWQYGRLGMCISMGIAGLVYILAPLWMPSDAFLWRFYVIRGFVLLGVTLILAFTTTLLAEVQRAREAELQSANRQLHEANRQLTEQAVLVEEVAASRERTRLARELHDTLAHSLSGTAIQLQAVGTLLAIDPDAASKELKLAQTQIKEGLVESRRAIEALRATPLAELGLAEALRQRVTDIGERLGLATDVEIDITPDLDHAHQSALLTQTIYRIADESLLNVEKHAYARHVRCILVQDETQVELSIVDDGQGFEIGYGNTNGHYGILGMKERAEMVGGVLQVMHEVGHGTKVCLNVPLGNTDTNIH